MRFIELDSLTLEHFRSFDKRTTIGLSVQAGLKFISGDNKAEPRLGANGAGKSTVFDALCFCCYGTSTRGLHASDLTSWGAKQTYVAATFIVNGERIVIERYGSPNRLLVHGQPVEQTAVDTILGLNRARFMQSVLFGQQVPLFIDLPVPKRGELLDTVLDLDLWVTAAEVASTRCKGLTEDIETFSRSMAFYQGKLVGLGDRKEVQCRIAEWDEKRNKELDDAILIVEQRELELQERQAKANSVHQALRANKKPYDIQKAIDRAREGKAKLEAEYRRLFAMMQENNAKVEFFHHKRTCPTCNQKIPQHTAEEQLKIHRNFVDRDGVNIQVNASATRQVNAVLQELEGEYDKTARKHEFLTQQYANALAAVEYAERTIDGAVNYVEQIAARENPYLAELEKLEKDRAAAEQGLLSAKLSKRKYQSELIKADFWRQAFKRVRLFLIKRILTHLEMEVGNAAALLGLVGWKIEFSTELETKSGTLRPGIHVQITSPKSSATWEAWSGGEGQRIRLAVTQGMSALIQRLAGVKFGFEVWDEPMGFLSEIGMEDLLECLKHRADSLGKSVWICDHRALVYSGFDELWSVTKTAAGSSMEMII